MPSREPLSDWKKAWISWGITILGLTTGVGGGIIRDIIIGQTPPLTFRDPTYLIISVVVSVIVFTPPVRKWIFSDSMLYEWLMLIMDSVGLGVFTVLGIKSAYTVPQSRSYIVHIRWNAHRSWWWSSERYDGR